MATGSGSRGFLLAKIRLMLTFAGCCGGAGAERRLVYGVAQQVVVEEPSLLHSSGRGRWKRKRLQLIGRNGSFNQSHFLFHWPSTIRTRKPFRWRREETQN